MSISPSSGKGGAIWGFFEAWTQARIPSAPLSERGDVDRRPPRAARMPAHAQTPLGAAGDARSRRGGRGAAADARTGSRDRLRVGALPQPRRVPRRGHGDLPRPRRRLHPPLRLLRRGEGPPRAAGPGRAGGGRRCGAPPGARPRGRDLGDPRRPARRRRRPPGRDRARVREAVPGARVELLVPDFAGAPGALETVLAAGPDVLAHNLETVPRLYSRARPGAGLRPLPRGCCAARAQPAPASRPSPDSWSASARRSRRWPR